MKILLVDDEEIVRKTTGEVLQDMGHTVFLAENVETALHAIRHDTFDVLITDFQMPGQNGRELIEELRAGEICPPKVILMSANTHSNLPTGVIFLKKPFSMVELEKIIEETE
ncbi:MAG: response regulator [Candidatus Parcubacteria bacterium]|nr:response regulator [Candidatus Parcubacteria bacterium]